MKSLVEEASSIAKAIEKAWERAGKPQAFSVKIYEIGEKNFLGFTKKSAKVGIFFEEEQVRTNDRRPHGQNQRPQNRPHQNTSYTDRLERTARNEKPERTERTERPDRMERTERAERPERMERTERPAKNNSHEQPKSAIRPTQQPRPSRPVHEERPEERLETVSQEPRERYVRQQDNDGEGQRRDRRGNGGRSDRRNDDRRGQRRSGGDENSERRHREPMVQPYPHTETPSERPQQEAHHAPVEQSSERPVMGIPVAQTQRKVLKVSSRRYTGNKPAVEEPKKPE